MNFQEAEIKIREAIDKHIASGGRLITGDTVLADGKCKCALACLRTNSSESLYKTTLAVLGWDASQSCNFIEGFDDKPIAFTFGKSVEKYYDLGVKFRLEYGAKPF